LLSAGGAATAAAAGGRGSTAGVGTDGHELVGRSRALGRGSAHTLGACSVDTLRDATRGAAHIVSRAKAGNYCTGAGRALGLRAADTSESLTSAAFGQKRAWDAALVGGHGAELAARAFVYLGVLHPLGRDVGLVNQICAILLTCACAHEQVAALV
jgi:hypothetical protein